MMKIAPVSINPVRFGTTATSLSGREITLCHPEVPIQQSESAWAQKIVDGLTAALALNNGHWKGRAKTLDTQLIGIVAAISEAHLRALHSALFTGPLNPTKELSRAITERSKELGITFYPFPLAPDIYTKGKLNSLRPAPWRKVSTMPPANAAALVKAHFPTRLSRALGRWS